LYSSSQGAVCKDGPAALAPLGTQSRQPVLPSSCDSDRTSSIVCQGRIVQEHAWRGGEDSRLMGREVVGRGTVSEELVIRYCRSMARKWVLEGRGGLEAVEGR
jgi:hypothetical protein